MITKVDKPKCLFPGLFFLLLLIPSFLATDSGVSWAFKQQTNTVHISSATLSRAIDMAASYLVNSVKENGQFEYKRNLYGTSKCKRHYNILRHAGSMYALVQAYQRKPSMALKEALLKTSGFLISRCLRPLPQAHQIHGIWSLPSITNREKEPIVKLGAVGLGLAALSMIEKRIPGTFDISELKKLGNFILFMQKTDGSFYFRFAPFSCGKCERKESIYYPGEAALGLLMLNRIYPSTKWITGITKALSYLIKYREPTTSDQWVLIACARLISTDEYPQEILPRSLIQDYALVLSRMIIEEQVVETDSPCLAGSYHVDGRVTPTSTRIEALLAALKILGKADTVMSNTIRASINSAMQFLLKAQVVNGKLRGGFPRVASCNGYPEKGAKNRCGEIRIDYVQHALSAMIGYEKLITPKLN